MRESDYSELRYRTYNRLRGQTLTPAQAGQLRDMITEHTLSGVDEGDWLPLELPKTWRIFLAFDRFRRRFSVK